jgi:P63C domain
MANSPQSLGGKARAKRLSSDERRRIASEAAQARWNGLSTLPEADFPGVLQLGAAAIPCAVLSDGRRVLSETGITNALLGSRSGASKRLKKVLEAAGAPTPLFLAPRQLKRFITSDLVNGPLKPVLYREGSRVSIGYDGTILRAACEIWLRAREAGALQKQQLEKAQKAEVLLRALADIGIIALIDEVTGYQKARARDELQRILAAYISPELLPWTKRFPDSYYEHLHRVRGWKYEPGSHARNAYIGKLTNALIYEQLPEGVLEELRRRNPTNPLTKRRRHNHHELLTSEVGHPHLDRQIVAVTTLLSVSDDWADFSRLFCKKFPPGPGDLFALPAPEK